MNARPEGFRPSVPASTAPHDTPPPSAHAHDGYRDYIAEQLAMIRIQAEVGETHASIGDDAALTYAMRRLAGHMKAAIGALADLKQAKAGGCDAV